MLSDEASPLVGRNYSFVKSIHFKKVFLSFFYRKKSELTKKEKPQKIPTNAHTQKTNKKHKNI